MSLQKLLDRYPSVPQDQSPRKLFFDGLSEELTAALIARRYVPTAIVTMPVSTPDERREQLRGISQGMSDGTIEATTARLKGVELAMRELGMLSDKNRTEKSAVKEPETTSELVDAIKGRGGSTLRDAKHVDRKKILEDYGNSATIKKADGKIRAAKTIKREKR